VEKLEKYSYKFLFIAYLDDEKIYFLKDKKSKSLKN
jgi:hypothetical protein